jgi:hypothetical protein
MTWVVGATSFFGYGALYSDIRVTFSDGTTQDVLQKAYPITNFIAAGFAGSVRIGFCLLQSLAQSTWLPDEAQSTQAWDPIWVAKRWSGIAREVFNACPADEKALGAQFLMLGASPTEGLEFGSRMFLVRFAAPDFRPGIMGRVTMSCSIGTGSGVGEYKRSIKPLLRVASGINRAEVMNRNGLAQELVFSISRAVNWHPRDGISSHFHAVVVRRGSMSTWNNDENIYHADGSVVKVRMPPVARSYDEFLELAKRTRSVASCAIC